MCAFFPCVMVIQAQAKCFFSRFWNTYIFQSALGNSFDQEQKYRRTYQRSKKELKKLQTYRHTCIIHTKIDEDTKSWMAKGCKKSCCCCCTFYYLLLSLNLVLCKLILLKTSKWKCVCICGDDSYLHWEKTEREKERKNKVN